MTTRGVIGADAAAVVDRLPAFDQLAGARVLVTGATGTVGRYVVEVLLELSARLDRSLHVLALARSADALVGCFGAERPGLETIRGDVVDVELAPVLPVTHVVHAASPATPDRFAADPVGVVRANVFGAARLLDLLRDVPDGWFGLVSTMEIYGEVARAAPDADLLLAESAVGTIDSLELRSAYPESKRLAENLCVGYAAQYGVRADVARLSHTYGPGMARTDSRVQAQFLRQALAGEQLVLKSDGSTMRTYTYVADAAAALVHLLVTSGERGNGVVDAFNVADEQSRTSIRGLAEAVLIACGRDPAELRIDLAPSGSQLWSRVSGATYLDCSKLRALGWSARYHLADGLARTVAHHREDTA